MDASALKVGMLVTVGPAYKMADNPPCIGNGTYENDRWTGRTMQIVALSGEDGVSLPGAELATPLTGADIDDAEVWINLRRLTKI